MRKNSFEKAELIPKTTSLPEDYAQMYLRELKQFPVLSKEEEEHLSQQFYNTKDPRIARELAQANLRFVVKIAAEYTRFGAQLIDLIQEGNIGLLQAIKEFNPYKGVRLITYAVWWIRGYIQEYLLRQYSLVRMATNTKQRKLFYLLRRQQEQLAQLPYEDDIKLLTHSGFKEKDVQAMRERLSVKDLSLDQPLSKNHQDNYNILDIQKNNGEESLEENLNVLQETAIMRKGIERLRSTLNVKELFVLNKRLLSESPLTLQEIGQKFSVTREAIRQIEVRLIKKIKEQMAFNSPQIHETAKQKNNCS